MSEDSLITVRDARPEDVETIADFNARLAWETEEVRLDPPTLRRGVARVLADRSRGRYFVAEGLAGGRPEVVGCLMVTYEFSDWRDADLWWIQSVYVRHDWRRRGVFKAMYRHIRDLARAAGVGGLRLYVERENHAAQRTYQSLGMNMEPYFVMGEMFVTPWGD